MLTLTLQLIFSLTIIGEVFAEKLFHNRDHSDVVISASHQAELITDTDTAEVTCSFFLGINYVLYCSMLDRVRWQIE